MSHRFKGREENPHIMDALLSGSVADEQVPSIRRVLHTESSDNFDPFLSVNSYHYSPPRVRVPRNSVSDVRAHSNEALPGRSGKPYYSPYTASYAVAEPDDAGSRSHNVAYEAPARKTSQDPFEPHFGSSSTSPYLFSRGEDPGQPLETATTLPQNETRRRPLHQDEFDGPAQLLPLPLAHEDTIRAQQLPSLPMHLGMLEQDEVIQRHNDALAACAFHFIAKYQFPVPVEREKPPIRSASDRDWTEWAYLLKRLATKRRIPARLLYDSQIKHLVTILENSVVIRSRRARDQVNPDKVMKDDRQILQLLSAGVQVARILMDSLAMQQLIDLYIDTETVIAGRRERVQAGRT